jgi:hypothetical protein
VHICTSVSVAKSELPRLLSGDLSVAPSSGYGSNIQRNESERRIPRAILRAAAFSDEDIDELKAASKELAGLDYVKVTKEDLAKAGCTVEAPDAGMIAGILKEKLPKVLG